MFENEVAWLPFTASLVGVESLALEAAVVKAGQDVQVDGHIQFGEASKRDRNNRW